MKKLLCCIAVYIPFILSAQLRLPVLNNNVSSTLIKVIEDFPNHFNNIKGEIIDKDVQSITYRSLINITDADSSVIIQNGDSRDNIYSWKEVVFNAEDFDKAKIKFHEYFRKIKGTAASVDNNKIAFDADYVEPDNAKQFTTVLFIAHPQTRELKNLMIDLSLHYLMDNWQISVSVYEHTNYGVDDVDNNHKVIIKGVIKFP